jgi:hypothetical protein
LRGSYLRLTNLVVDANRAESSFDDACTGSLNVSVWGDHNEVRGVEIRNGRMSGLYISGADHARTRSLAAESAIEMTVCRAAMARGAGLIDEHEAAHPATHGSDEQLIALFTEAQAVKTYVNEAAARLVDRALALVGGAAFRSGHPIRAYRDVRAGAFMNPLASGRAYELIGQVALGLRVSLS